VVITGVTVTGANDHGIFAQDVTGLLISKSIVRGNGVAPHTCHGNQTNCVSDEKAVQLAGTHNAVVTNNVVTGNNGGIALTDDGFINPGAINPGTVSASVGNVVSMNYVNGTGDCGIIVAGFNPGKVIINNTIFGNIIVGNSPKNPGPYVGQIVVAADGPNATLWNTVVRGNIIEGSLLPGIVVHSNAPGDVIDGTSIIGNNIANNAGYPPASFTTVNDPVNATGIAVMAEAFPGMHSPPIVSHTYIAWNVITGDTYGIWTCQTTGTTIPNIWGNSGTSKTACSAGP
jgi:parallel beta-helix repeat protein